MTLGITIDVNGQVIERIEVTNVGPPGERAWSKFCTYKVTEIHHRDDGSTHSHTYRKTILHRRKDGALHLVAKTCEFLSYERRKR